MAGKIVIFIMVLLVLIFVFQNTDIVRVSFLAWEISMSRALMILLTFLIGLITGWLSGRTKRVKQEK